MRPKRLTYTLAALDADGYLNEATGVGPWTTFLAQPADGCAHPVTLASGQNLSAINFTITGTDAEGRAISEVLAGPNVNTVTSVQFYKTVTSISASATVGANTFDAGWTAVAVTPIVPVSPHASVGPLLTVDIGGTVNFDGQATNDEVFKYSGSNVFFLPITGMTGATADAAVAVAAGTTGVRVKVNSHTGGTLNIIVSQGA